MYAERVSRVPGAVVWTRSGGGDAALVLPDGCMDLIWLGDRLVVAGPDTRAYASPLARGEAITGLRFAPGTAPANLGVPAQAVRDQRVPLDAVWTARAAHRLESQIVDGRNACHAMELAVLARDAVPPAPVLTEIVRRLQAGESVSRVAEAVGWSVRRLHRRSLDAFGYGPKMLARVLRLGLALDLVRAGGTAADAAARAGYADQAHLARDVRALTGTTLRRVTGYSGANRSTPLPSGSRSDA